MACTLTSSADTGSSATRMSGRSARARAIATRWRWPPENCRGYADSPPRPARPGEQFRAERRDPVRRHHVVHPQQLAQHAADGQPGVQRGVRVLEDHLDPAPVRPRPRGREHPAVETDLAAVRAAAARPGPGPAWTCPTRTRRRGRAPRPAASPGPRRRPRAAGAPRAGSGRPAREPTGNVHGDLARREQRLSAGRGGHGVVMAFMASFTGGPDRPRRPPWRARSAGRRWTARPAAAAAASAARPAVLLGERAARVEPAAGRRADQARRRAGDRHQRLAHVLEVRGRTDQPERVRVARIEQHLADLARSTSCPPYMTATSLADLGHHRQVVGDEDQADARTRGTAGPAGAGSGPGWSRPARWSARRTG